MNKRIALVLGVLLLTFVLWRWMESPSETNSQSSHAPPAAVSQKQTPFAQQAAAQTPVTDAAPAVTAEPSANHAAFDPRAAALAAFARKQKAAGLENQAAPLQPAAQAFSRVRKSKTRDINGRGFQILAARAVPKAEYNTSMGEALYEQNGFIVIPLPTAMSDRWNDLTWRELDRPVVVNPVNGRVAVVTGTLIVKLKDMAAAERIAASERLTIAARDEDIHVVYLRPMSEYSLLSGQQRLRAQGEVERVDIELYQSRKEAK